MNPENVKKQRKIRRTKLINIRISPEVSKWMKKNEFSPTAIFYEALRELKCPFAEKE